MSSSTQAVAGAMDMQIMAQDVAARNIANVVTPGFKRNIALVEAIAGAQGGGDQNSPVVTGVGLDMSQGPLQSTSNDLDVAVQGEGFFAVQTPRGVLYTRNGTFRLNENGVLVTQDGAAVQGESGEIQIPPHAGKVTIGSDGQVIAGTGAVGKLKVVAFDKPGMLQQAGGSTYAGDAAQPRAARAYAVHQGFVEGSNVEAVSEMVRMMSTFRDYQACARSLRSIEDSATSLYSWARS